MSRDTEPTVRNIRWITFSLIIIAIHYWLYLRPLINEFPEAWVIENQGFLLLMRTKLCLLILMIIVALVFVVRRMRYWHGITAIACGIGIYAAYVPELFDTLFRGVDSLEAVLRRLAIFAKYPKHL